MKPGKFITKLGLFFIFLLIGVVNHSCRKDNQDIVPYVPVNLILDIQTDLGHLGVGETATIIPDEQGYGVLSFSAPNYPVLRLGQEVSGNGLILYRLALYEFMVFDRTCTFQANIDYCALEMDDTGLVPECPCCQSQFMLPLEGAVIKGPAVLPLKTYQTYINNYRLFISN
jgi:hypothetical protein